MLRTTISKIRKVCTIAFVPRILRGNLRYTPSIYAAFGKFEKFTLAVKSVRKSTKATGDDDQMLTPEKQLKDGVSTVALSKPLDLGNKNEIYQSIKVSKTDTASNISTTATSSDDKCSKVISEIFGEEKVVTVSPVTPQENLLLLSHINVPSYMNRVCLTDKNMTGIFGKYDSKSFNTTPYVSARITDGKSEDSFQSVLCYDAVLMNEKGAKDAKGSQSKPVENEKEIQKFDINLYDVDPKDYMTNWNIDTKALKLAPDETELAEQEIDAYWTDVYETAIENKAASYESSQAIDVETLNIYKSMKKDDDDDVTNDATLEQKRISLTSEELERIICGSPYDDAITNKTLQATTDKQTLEILAQKIEHIDEAPLVEAEKSKIEGFNSSPKILGNLDESVKTIKPTAVANTKNLDEVANRCLNLPQTEIDKILLKEMEQNLSIPIAGNNAADEVKIEDSLHSNALQSSKKTIDDYRAAHFNLINLMPNNLTGLGGIKINPSTLQAEEQYWHDLKRARTAGESKGVVQSNRTVPEINVRELNTITFDNLAKLPSKKGHAPDEKLEQNIKLKPKQSPEPITLMTSNDINANLSENIWVKDHLDPKHILTCNETCPISPKPLVNTNELKSLKDTEAVFERSVLTESGLTQKDEDDVKAQKNITDESIGSAVLKESNHPCRLSVLNAQAPKSLEDYMKMVQSGSSQILNDKANVEKDPTNRTNSSAVEVKSAKSAQIPEMEIDSQMVLAVPINYGKEIGTLKTSKNTAAAEAAKSSDSEPLQNAKDVNESITGSTINSSELTIDTAPCAVYEHVRDKPNIKTKEDSAAYLVETIQATQEKLQTTSEQLQVTTEQLQVTSEQLEAASEQLLATSEQLLVTSEKLESTCEHFKQNNAKHTYSGEIPSELPSSPSVDSSVDPLTKSPGKPSSKAFKDSPVESTILTTPNKPGAEADQDSLKAQLTNYALSSTFPVGDNTTTQPRLPEIKDKIKLSELMKLVKERNQRTSSLQLLTKPVEAKKSIPPMQQPMHKTRVFRAPSYPKLKPKPKVCVPRKKPKKTNFSQCDLKALGLNHCLGPLYNRNETPNNNYQQEALEIALPYDALPSANLTDEIILQLQNMGYVLESAYERGKVNLESVMVAKTRYQFRTRNYEPWIPIPSWPFPKKNKGRPKLQCPSDGCPALPPQSISDPPCGLKPCKTFPTYPKRTFSVLDYCTISLGEPTFVDIGEF